MLNNWPLICKNSVVDIIAPSGKIESENIAQIEAYIRSLGLTPRIPKNLLGEHPFCANKDEIRFEHLKNALYADDSSLIWCVRGGHGVTRILPQLTKLPKPDKQKLLIGFSDITSLHLWLNQAWQWPSLHGPMVRQIAAGLADPLDVAAEEKILFEGINDYVFGPLTAINALAKETNFIEGITAGTCLSLLQTSIGTPWQLQPHDKILVIEDVNEFPYRADRLLVHLTNAGLFNGVKAIIFGDFGEEAETIHAMNNVLADFANQYLPNSGLHIPVYRIEGFGHCSRNKPLPLGVSAQLKHGNLYFN
jgi:muramoyltetrapeptide carboxypeptidase